MAETFKSPRKIEEEIRNYKRERFEKYMTEVDDGRLTRELAIAALREEVEYIDDQELLVRQPTIRGEALDGQVL